MIKDRVFCIIYLADRYLDKSRLVYYMYLLQLMDWYLDLGFHYKLATGGMLSRDLDKCLDGLVLSEHVSIKNDKLCLTNLGELYSSNLYLTCEEEDFLDDMLDILDRLTIAELRFVCCVDMVVNEVKNKCTASEFAKSRGKITNYLMALSAEYSAENFNSALKIIRMLKEGF